MDASIIRAFQNLPQDGTLPPAYTFAGPDIPIGLYVNRCRACQIPRHGFLCFFSDGTCLKYPTPNQIQQEESQ